VNNTFFTKSEEYLRAKYLEGTPEEGGARKAFHLPSLKRTTVYNLDNDLT